MLNTLSHLFRHKEAGDRDKTRQQQNLKQKLEERKLKKIRALEASNVSIYLLEQLIYVILTGKLR